MTGTPLLSFSAALPGGTVTLFVDDAENSTAVVAAGYFDEDTMFARLSADLRDRGRRSVRSVAVVSDALTAYANGQLDALDAIEVRQPGGPFTQAAWIALRQVSAGTVDTYTGLAARAGRPAAIRAAGSACAKNLVAPIVPCHRILRTDGTLGGYYYGLEVKRALLRHEGIEPSTLWD